MENRWLAAGACVALTAMCGAGTITVDDDGSADFDEIQAAVDFASDGDLIVVAAGVYTSDQDGHVIDLKGKNIVILSKDGAASTIIDGQNERRGFACYNGETSSTVIEGFTVRNGHAAPYDYDGDGQSNYWDSHGGGMYIHGSSPTIQHCIIAECTAGFYGGGMFCTNDSEAIILHCNFKGNTAGYAGGGLACTASNLEIEDCVFRANISPTGGGINNGTHSNSHINGCTFTDNFASVDGGGMHNTTDSNSRLTYCTFSGNSATYLGGAMKNWNSSPVLRNCIITQNEASVGGGVWSGFESASDIARTEICANVPDQIHGAYTDSGENSIADECFDACVADINDDGTVNGIDVTIVLASWNLTDVPADLNGDGIVNGADLTILLASWGVCP